ncbi:MAG: hypothetical protein NC301_06335 [Bacteroides sp.]|nr:hypothetical protein [Bacteroides sp.]MCM1378890.1 hypothetical protein [Bacteroides sp.]MCM1445506.1 hypothetical protein [Prevotella sp.]
MQFKHFIGALALAIIAAPSIFAQAVIFPQKAQPGAATLTAVNGTYILANDLFSASFIETDGSLLFDGCSAMGLKPGTELFFVETKSDGIIPASRMTMSGLVVEDLAANPDSPKGGERFSGKALSATFTFGNISILWYAILRDGSHYLRTELSLTSDLATEMKSVIPMNYTVADGEPTVNVVGNTRGAILASSKIFAGVESPMGINSVGSEIKVSDADSPAATYSDEFSLTSWKPEMFCWTPGREVPSQILELGFDDSQVLGAYGLADFTQAGSQTVTFTYRSGNLRLNMVGVDIVDSEGQIAASDYHIGFAGGQHSNNVYTLNVPQAGQYTIRFFVETKTEGITSSGNITYSATVNAVSDPDEPELSPVTPISGTDHFWTIMSDRGSDPRYVTEVDGGLMGNTIVTEPSRWHFISRTDGTWDIVNASTGNYITTGAANNSQLKTSKDAPAKGWEFKVSNNPQAWIIVNGESQFNTTNNSHSFQVFNWGSGTNTTDGGCQYYFEEVAESLEFFEKDTPITGKWSRQTTLAVDKTWKIGAVVGLVAPDQPRRSVLAYIERERAAAWRPMPMYNSWYELNINRNNDQNYTTNFNINQCVDVLNQWKENLYDKHNAHIQSYVWDDGWDSYGTWTFNPNFPNGFKEADEVAAAMGANIGAWLGPVGGYGQSGTYRRNYWNGKGGMQLSNPEYYDVFLTACTNMINDYHFNYFKFDGISAQFSSVGPDSGATGEENAEAIIDIEQRIREIKPDIFFNTTVGTWASPFWYHVSDATWRQESDFGTIGNQGSDRERWITYRDRLVYQNYVINSPLCPINSMMTHGVILTKFGSVAKDMGYEGALREIRCAFACGSSQVELYCDYELLNSINDGALWGDIAECIKWQEANADVLPDAHWVGGNPWDGSKANIYGWASWNGLKSTLALRNPAASNQEYTFTLREAFDIPAYITGEVVLTPAFAANQDALEGVETGKPINIDTPLTATLKASSLYVFDGIDPNGEQDSIKEIDCREITTERPANGATYDLMGRRVANPTRGLYIVNGKVVRR